MSVRRLKNSEENEEKGTRLGDSIEQTSSDDPGVGTEIYVGIRLRPAVDPEEKISEPVTADVLESKIKCLATNTQPISFKFDTVFNQHASQQDVMRKFGVRAVERVVEGYNGAVICYGQSGSGKTHSLIGDNDGFLNNLWCPDDPDTFREGVGMLPRMLFSLFSRLEAKFGSPRNRVVEVADEDLSEGFLVEISAVELYMEELRDLIPSAVPLNRVPNVKSGDGGFSQDALRSSVGKARSSVKRPFDSPSPFQPALSALPSRGPSLRIRQSGSADAVNSSVMVEGLQRHKAFSFEEAIQWTQQALYARKIGETNLNRRSNRSHTIFFVYVTQQERERKTESEPELGGLSSEETFREGWPIAPLESTLDFVQTKYSMLTLVDLAGSERVSHTGAEGLQLAEAQRINLSLTLLGNVIRRLSEKSVLASQSAGSGKHSAASTPFIPYRDSKLTRLLQDCLGGNTISFLLCNIAPEDKNRIETLSTLRFAALTKNIKNKAKVNAVRSAEGVEDKLREALDYISWLENQLQALKEKRRGSGSPSISEAFMSDVLGEGMRLNPRSTTPTSTACATSVSKDSNRSSSIDGRNVEVKDVPQLSSRKLVYFREGVEQKESVSPRWMEEGLFVNHSAEVEGGRASPQCERQVNSTRDRQSASSAGKHSISPGPSGAEQLKGNISVKTSSPPLPVFQTISLEELKEKEELSQKHVVGSELDMAPFGYGEEGFPEDVEEEWDNFTGNDQELNEIAQLSFLDASVRGSPNRSISSSLPVPREIVHRLPIKNNRGFFQRLADTVRVASAVISGVDELR